MVINIEKKQPIRMCCACRKHAIKWSLIRFVVKGNNIIIDDDYRESGRGAYLCRDIKCLKKAKKIKALNRALKVCILDYDYDKIESELLRYG